ncbi:hypothetical protein A1Q2_04349 [Trichosporon asahii var. asahii CBS 8904]|uniref:Uncharacterized protein n=1 Tax=Trichosporon asahii var. asahii (strain CBS 8904) TaxID=1220162 RepID=K1VKS7_TRIAC|nr:hypothetical protein A1Q2_04349 [Trichosporon asahii var. asahii CBS 8904]
MAVWLGSQCTTGCVQRRSGQQPPGVGVQAHIPQSSDSGTLGVTPTPSPFDSDPTHLGHWDSDLSSSFVDPIYGFCLSFHRTSPYGTHAQSSALGARSLIASLSRLDRDDAAALLNKLKWIRLDTLGTVKAGMAEYGRGSELQGAPISGRDAKWISYRCWVAASTNPPCAGCRYDMISHTSIIVPARLVHNLQRHHHVSAMFSDLSSSNSVVFIDALRSLCTCLVVAMSDGIHDLIISCQRVRIVHLARARTGSAAFRCTR